MKSKELKKSSQESDDKIIYMSFGISEKLKNRFKSKVSSKGEKVKYVISNLIKEYVDCKK